ncbi:hypothetical protein ACFU7Y_39290 [Kitasatospora sp. NPDC057542]|uniref:hypothetical protein n=1 Tax=Kitasatospora sp. NPDC057542 TaxID=3346162 RepID=UPI003682FF45
MLVVITSTPVPTTAPLSFQWVKVVLASLRQEENRWYHQEPAAARLQTPSPAATAASEAGFSVPCAGGAGSTARQDLSCGPVLEGSAGGQLFVEALSGADTEVCFMSVVAALSVPTRLPRGDAGTDAAEDGEAIDTCPPAITRTDNAPAATDLIHRPVCKAITEFLIPSYPGNSPQSGAESAHVELTGRRDQT